MIQKREELVKKLENLFGKKVIALIYNPENEEGIRKGDERYIRGFLEKENLSKNIDNCIVLLNGSGGDFETALLISYILRNNFPYFSCFIPTVAGSALCYIIIHGNKLLVGKDSLLTQIDPIFEYEGESYRAIKRLDDPNEEIHNKAHDIFNYVIGHLERLLSHKHSILKSREVKLGDMSPIIYLFMGKDYHESGVRLSEVQKLNINIQIVEEDKINVGKELVNECHSELIKENSRFVFQTSNGGYFSEK